ncbi:FxsC protein [Streptomyces sviceus]|uniref:FxsC protein n=1 Tax=Streptomyces sviceus TaxID=285530 RepID=UPI0033337899
MRADAADPGSGRPHFFLSHARTPRHESEFAGPDAPLSSPRYFISERYGREWWAFSQREIRRRTRRGGSRESAVVPGSWAPVERAPLPQAARDLRFQHADFGEEYAARGMSLPSAFGGGAHPPGFEVTVIARSRSDLPPGRVADRYGDTPLEWNPFHPVSTRPLAEQAADLVRTMNYRFTVSGFGTGADRVLTMGPPTTPALMPRWALDSPRAKGLMVRPAARQRPWISVMIPQHRDGTVPPELDRQSQELADRVPTAQRLVGPSHRSPGGTIGTLDAFQLELRKAVRQTVNHHEARARTCPPKGPPLDPPRLPRPGHGV